MTRDIGDVIGQNCATWRTWKMEDIDASTPHRRPQLDYRLVNPAKESRIRPPLVRRLEYRPIFQPNMPPQMSKYGAADGENAPLSSADEGRHVEPMEYKSLTSFGASNADEENQQKRRKAVIIAGAVVAVAGLVASVAKSLSGRRPIGPYELSSVQEGSTFFDNYEFYDGPDSLGSAGYNDYVSKKRATMLNIANITKEGDATFIYMSSVPTEEGPRESVRLEGKTRYDRGLFILDLRHMPAGCGVWPAWWLTDEAAWPDNGEIDIVEGINYQTVAKTALHTSDRCSMFAHVPAWAKTGEWDRASEYYSCLCIYLCICQSVGHLCFLCAVFSSTILSSDRTK